MTHPDNPLSENNRHDAPREAYIRLRNALSESLPLFLSQAASFPEPLRKLKPTDQAFSATEIVYHMLSVEELWQRRMHGLVDGSTRNFQALDPDADARDNRFNEREYASGLHELEASREETLRFLDNLSEDELQLEGIHSKYGPMSILRILEIMSTHDRNHAAQLERTLTALTATSLRTATT